MEVNRPEVPGRGCAVSGVTVKAIQYSFGASLLDKPHSEVTLFAMTSSSPSRHDTLLRIKAAPPRPRRWWLQRGRLLARFANLRERPLLAVQAPAGFGKTSLLASLRREWLATPAYVS